MTRIKKQLEEIYEEGEKNFLIKLSNTQKEFLKEFREQHAKANPGTKRLSISDVIALCIEEAKPNLEAVGLLMEMAGKMNQNL